MTTFFIVFAGWLFSLCLHEFAHAGVAYLGGDTSVRDKGYLTFNPFKYLHPVYSVIMPLLFLVIGGLGLPGGAVMIDRSRLRDKLWASNVSLAGPGSNLLLALVIGGLLHIPGLAASSVGPAFEFLGVLQISAVVLNLLPIPPLDGYGVIAPYLPESLQMTVNRFGGIGMWVVFLCLWYVPGVNDAFRNPARSGLPRSEPVSVLALTTVARNRSYWPASALTRARSAGATPETAPTGAISSRRSRVSIRSTSTFFICAGRFRKATLLRLERISRRAS
jgi:Zn-dependent protease